MIQGDLFRGLQPLGKHRAPPIYGEPIFDLAEVDGARGRGAWVFKAGLEKAEAVGREIFRQAQARGAKTRDGVADVNKPIRGMTAELAWWVASGFFWNSHDRVEYNVNVEDCGKTEVKSVKTLSIGPMTRKGAWAPMPLMKRDFELRSKRHKPHVVAAPLRHNLTLWWFHGWYTPAEAAKNDDWWVWDQYGLGLDGKGVGAWVVECDQMWDLELLKEQ